MNLYLFVCKYFLIKIRVKCMKNYLKMLQKCFKRASKVQKSFKRTSKLLYLQYNTTNAKKNQKLEHFACCQRRSIEGFVRVRVRVRVTTKFLQLLNLRQIIKVHVIICCYFFTEYELLVIHMPINIINTRVRNFLINIHIA